MSSEQQAFQQGKLPSIHFPMTGKAREMGCSVPPNSQGKTFQFNSNVSALENGDYYLECSLQLAASPVCLNRYVVPSERECSCTRRQHPTASVRIL